MGSRRLREATAGVVAGVAFALSTAAIAEEDGVGASDPQLEALTRAQQLAELRKAIAEAELATLEARWPSAEVEVAKGDVVVGDKAGYFAEMLAYGGLADAAKKIAAGVGRGDNQEIVVTSRMNVGRELRFWQLVKHRLDGFENAFNILKCVTIDDFVSKGENQTSSDINSRENGSLVGPKLPILSSLLGGVAEIAGFFKSDVEIKSREVTLNEAALVAEVARRLKKNGWDVVLPDLNPGESGVLLKKLNTLEKRWHEAHDQLRDLADAIWKLRSSAGPEKKEEIKAHWERTEAAFSHVLTGYGEYRTSLTKSTKEAVAPILILEFADDFKSRERSHRLHVSIATQGAEVLTAKWPWTPGKVSYGGGGAFVFAWIDSDGNLADAGLVGGWQSKTREARRAIESVPWIDEEESKDG